HRLGGDADQPGSGRPVREPSVGLAPRPARRSRRRTWLWGSLSLGALAAGLLVAVTLWPQPHGANVAPGDAEPTDNTVAILLQAPGAVWEKSDLPTRVGAPLHPGWLHLKSGLAQVEFYRGAPVFRKG